MFIESSWIGSNLGEDCQGLVRATCSLKDGEPSTIPWSPGGGPPARPIVPKWRKQERSGGGR